MGFYSKCFRFEGGGRQSLGLKRTGKSCRLRWVNYLHPGLKRGKMTPHEEKLVLELHSQLGNRWSRIARRLPGRTDNEIKNYWRTHMRKKAQEKKTSSSSASASASCVVSPSSPSSNCSSNIINDTSSDYKANTETTSTTTGIPSYDKCKEISQEEEEEEVYSMDDIWKDISSSEETIKPMSSIEQASNNFSCVASPLWDYYSPWKMDDEESKMFNFPF